MDTNKKKFYTLDEIKDRYIGESGTAKREAYEYELRMEIISISKKRKNEITLL